MPERGVRDMVLAAFHVGPFKSFYVRLDLQSLQLSLVPSILNPFSFGIRVLGGSRLRFSTLRFYAGRFQVLCLSLLFLFCPHSPDSASSQKFGGKQKTEMKTRGR